MTGEERIAAMVKLGYSEGQATFLVVVALNGGYFLRRQFLEFTDTVKGRPMTDFVEKLLARGHARTVRVSPRTELVRLRASEIFDALGEPTRTRFSPRAPLSIKTRLLGLDYIVAHKEQRFLSTERERVEYFSTELQLEPALLPKRLWHVGRSGGAVTRHFAEPFPIGVAPSGSHAPGQVSFCYVHAGGTSGKGLESYLRLYRPLLERVEHARVVYVAEDNRKSEGAQAAFGRFWADTDSAGSQEDSRTSSILGYFQIRARYEAGAFDNLTTDDLQALGRGREAFGGPRFEELFERWRRDGDRAVVAAMEREMPRLPNGRTTTPTFATWCSLKRYDLLGTHWRA